MLLQVDVLIGSTTLVFMGRDGEKQRQQKTRITIRLPNDLLDFFKREAAKTIHAENPIGYQGLINESLRRDIDSEEYLQRILREKRYK
jgi:uncharacterized protein (DUF4415 family)